MKLFKYIHFLNFEKIHIVTVHNYSSQLGFLFTQREYLGEMKSNKYLKDLYLIFIYPSISDKHIKNNVPIYKFLKSNKKNKSSKILVFKIGQVWQRLFLVPLLFILYFLIKEKILLWQSKYRWIEDSLEFKNFIFFQKKISLPIPKFKLVLFGDGFLSFMPVQRPFWLRQKNYLNPVEIKRIYKSYHLFDVANNHKKFNSKKLDPKRIVNGLEYYVKNKFDKKIIMELSNFEQLYGFDNDSIGYYIFPTTTFYETGRTTLENEINLYISYLKQSKLKTFNKLIIKPHPTSSYEKNIAFINSINSDDFFKSKKIYLPRYKNKKTALSYIPLEILITYILLSNKSNIDRKIIFSCTSTAGLSIKTLFPRIEFDKAFGSNLVRKYIFSDFQEKRILQENIINEKLNKL